MINKPKNKAGNARRIEFLMKPASASIDFEKVEVTACSLHPHPGLEFVGSTREAGDLRVAFDLAVPAGQHDVIVDLFYTQLLDAFMGHPDPSIELAWIEQVDPRRVTAARLLVATSPPCLLPPCFSPCTHVDTGMQRCAAPCTPVAHLCEVGGRKEKDPARQVSK